MGNQVPRQMHWSFAQWRIESSSFNLAGASQPSCETGAPASCRPKILRLCFATQPRFHMFARIASSLHPMSKQMPLSSVAYELLVRR